MRERWKSRASGIFRNGNLDGAVRTYESCKSGLQDSTPDAAITIPMTNSHLAELDVSLFASESLVSAGYSEKNVLTRNRHA